MCEDDITKCTLSICSSYIHNTSLEWSAIQLLNKIDAQALLHNAAKHKIIPVCYKVFTAVQSDISEELLAVFENRTRRMMMRNMAMHRESQIIQQAFENERTPIFPYKGVHFMQEFYGDLSVRSSIDIDYALRIEDLLKSHDLMTQLGYSETKEGLNKSKIKRSRAYYLDYPWQKTTSIGANIQVEFHLSPAHKAVFIPVDFSTYLTPKIQANSFERPEISLEDHALFVLIHHGAIDIWGYLMQLIDLNQIFTVLDKTQTARFVQLCNEKGLMGFLNIGILLLDHLFGKSYMHLLNKELSIDLVEQIKKDCVQGNLAVKWSENRNKLKYHLLLRNSIGDQLRTLASISRYGIFKITGI